MRKDIVYHVGDFSRRAESLYKLEESRGTGYFGTGYYFTTEWEYCKSQGGGHRPLYSINISDYNLLYGDIDLHYALQDLNRYIIYYPYMKTSLYHAESLAEAYEDFKYMVTDEYHNRHSFSEMFEEQYVDYKQYELKNYDNEDYTLLDYIEEEGFHFYSLLEIGTSEFEMELYKLCDTTNPKWSKIDSLIEQYSLYFDVDEIRKLSRYQNRKTRMLINLGVSESKFDKIAEDIYKELEHYYEDGVLYADKSTEEMDSIPTMFIKALGYDGVYPNADCDNTTYGGVIYDLDLAKDVTLLSNDVGDYPENALAKPLLESLSFEQLKKEVVPESKANEHLNYFYKQRNKLNGQGNRNIKYVATEFDDSDGSISFLFRTDSTYIDEPKKELENDKLNDGEMIDNLSDEYALQLKICDFWEIFDSLIVEGDKVFSKKDMESILSLSQEVRIGCSCPSSYWQGSDFWLSQIDAELKPCTIKPKFWNRPDLRGETKVCKHLLSLLNHISFFLPQMAMGVKSELMTYGLF